MPKEEPPLSICHFFQLQSRYVWERIAFARRTDLSIRETTLTEELLYSFYQYFEAFLIPMRLFESKEEHRNGGDIEVLVQTDDGFILLAYQAKITYKSGNYKKFHHEVGGVRQIDLLQDYAARHGGIAHYLLYNFIPDYMMSPEVDAISSVEDYGITHILADDILSWMAGFERKGKKTPIPHFNTFHPAASRPFHELICELLANPKAYLRHIPDSKIKTLVYYDEDDVEDAASWRRVTSLARIGYIEERMAYAEPNEVGQTDNNSGLQSTKKQAALLVFKPKFRLVIGGENSGGGLYIIE